MKKLFLGLCTLIMIIIASIPVVFAANENGTKVFDEKTNIDIKKQWLIKCNVELDSNSIRDNIYVYDKNRNKVNVTITLNQDGKTIVVQAPKYGYKYGETYSIEIKASSDSIKSKNGKAMTRDIVMSFTIKDAPSTKVTEVRGNTAGNLLNSAGIIQSGDWLYFNPANSRDFTKIKSDGTSRTTINTDLVTDFNTVGDWIYYISADDGRIHKIKAGDSKDTKVLEEKVFDFLVINDWIYYTIEENNLFGGLWKAKIDGTSKTLVVKGSITRFNIYDGWIYYTDYDKDGLFKVKEGETEISNLLPGIEVRGIVVDNGWIYYQQVYDYNNKKLFKMSIDGTNKTKIIDNNSLTFNVIGDYIYYIITPEAKREGEWYREGILHRVKKDGTEDKELDSRRIRHINYIGEWLYCFTDDGDIYKMKPDGTEKKVFFDRDF